MQVAYGKCEAGAARWGAAARKAPSRPGARPVGAVGTALLVASVLAGCGVPDTGPEAAGAPAPGGRAAKADHWVRAFFAAQNGIWPVARAAPAGAGPQWALDELLAGPTRDERARGLSTALPAGTHRVRAEATSPGTVTLQLPWLVSELDRVAVNQLVCTAAAAPGVPGGKPPTDVLVQVHESGLPGEPWRVTCDETGAAVPVGAPRAGR